MGRAKKKTFLWDSVLVPCSPGSPAAVRFLALFLVVGAGLSSSLASAEIRVERRGAGASAESTVFLGGI